jgi:two-component system, NtrC family, sensor histidine kinase HydH
MPTPPQNQVRRNLLFDLSPWVLAAACTLLLLLLSLFAVSNYQREKELIEEALVEKSLTLVRFINSAARESLRDELRFGKEWTGWQELWRTALAQAVEQPGVEAVLLLDQQGRILVQAGGEPPRERLDPAAQTLVAALATAATPPPPYLFAVDRAANGDKRQFQLVVHQGPPDFAGRMDHGGMGPMMLRRFGQHPQAAAIQVELAALAALRPVYLVQLDFAMFTSPLQRQFLQIVILLVVIVLVGVGGTLSLFTLRGLRGSQLRLGEMRAFTDLVVSSLPVGLIAGEGDGTVKVCNPAARAILSLGEKEVLGRQMADALPPEWQKSLVGQDEADRAGRSTETRLTTGSGEVKTVQVLSLAVLAEQGSGPGRILMLQDLTAVRRLEWELRRSERMAALGKMAAGVAHELRNPLSSIKGLALLLQNHFPKGSEEASTAELLVGEVERLNRSIGELLEYARPAQLEREKVVINALIEKTLSLVAVDASSTGVAVRFSPGAELPEIAVDPDRIKQVLLNLLLNALQAMPDGGELNVHTALVDGGIEVLVADSGVGIAPENLARVFDPYYTTKNDGTGLGLALSAKIVEEHGGTIRISSRPGESTEVRLTLPLSATPPAAN